MRLTRLNLSLLRDANGATSSPGAEPLWDRLTDTSTPFVLSRRQVLGAAGVATVGTSPALKLLGDTFLGPLEVVGERRRVSFKLGGKERWAIDARWFAGTPRLAVERRGQTVRVSLSGARFPGTDLSADFICQLRPALTGHRMRISLALGRFRSEVSFERWLAGSQAAASAVRLNATVGVANAPWSVSIAGPARAVLTPAFSLQLTGSGLVSLRARGDTLASDRITISLLRPSEPSVLRRPAARRTRLTLERGAHRWPLDSFLSPRIDRAQPGALPGTLLATGSPFDRVHVELSERTVRGTGSALVAEGNGSTLGYRPNGHLQDGDGKPFVLRLERPRFAQTIDGGREQTALVAGYHPDATWLRAGTVSLLVGGAGEGNLFELTGRGGRLHLAATPRLVSFTVPLESALVEPASVGENVRLELVTSAARHPRTPDVARLRVNPYRPNAVEFQTSNLVISLLRPDVMLALTLEYTNFQLQINGTQSAVLVRTGSPAYLTVRFPPQYVHEEAADLEASEGMKPLGSAGRRLAGPSRLAFSIPASVGQIPYTLAGLLNWSKFSLKVAPTAQPPGGTTSAYIAAPGTTETAIEAPWHLFLSPSSEGGWAFEVPPATPTANGITELWHCRLGVVDSSGKLQEDALADRRVVRAIYSPDYTPYTPPAHYSGPSAADPFRASLDAGDRDQIVRLTSDFHLQKTGGGQYAPQPIPVDKFMLSSLGAWMTMQQTWDITGLASSGFDVESWRHEGVMGRDQYVRVVYKGYLWPFGNRASYVKVTERKFVHDPSGYPRTIAYLFQRTFVVVRQPDKSFTSSDFPSQGAWAAGYAGRGMPFKSIRITTRTTPDLIDPSTDPNGGGIPYSGGPSTGLGATAFYPRYNLNGTPTDVPFHLVGTDWEGNTAEFIMPLIFVDNAAAYPDSSNLETDLNYIQSYFASPSNSARRTPAFNGQKVAFAPASSNLVDPSKPVDPAVETVDVEFSGGVVPAGVSLPPDQPYFFPGMATAGIHIPAVKQLVGQSAPQNITLNPTYLQYGIDDLTNNPGQMFAALTTPVPLMFGQNNPGQPVVTPGVAAPNTNIMGLSASLGALGSDPTTLPPGQLFDPAQAFGSVLSAKLLGGITLSDLLSVVTDIAQVPRLVTNNLPDAIETNLDWNATPQDVSPLFKAQNVLTSDPATMTLTAHSRTPLPTNGSAQPTSYKIQGEIANFTLDFAAIALPFNKMSFTIENGNKPNVAIDAGEVQFESYLSFMNDLRQFLNSYSDPPYVDLSPTEISAGYRVEIPTIAVGAFSLQNIALGAGITVPFFGEPVQAKFDFAQREKPFLLTVYVFGGGGFLSVSMNAKGLESLEAALEFGAAVALNFGVACGSVSIMAGIYMKWDATSSEGSLTGFLDARGELEVLGIVTLTVEFYLGLTYQFAGPDQGKVSGEAFLTVGVEIGFFSVSVTIGPYKQVFAGGSSSSSSAVMRARAALDAVGPAPLPIAQMVSASQWTTYCQAFGA